MTAVLSHFRMLAAILLAIAIMPAWGTLGADDESVQELVAKAQAGGDNQAELFAKAARRQVETVNEFFTKGEVDKGHAAVQDVVTLAQKALDAAKLRRKRLKQTDITLRKASRRLSDVAATLAFEDRPSLTAAVKEIEGIRTQILGLMFGHKAPEKNSPEATAPKD